MENSNRKLCEDKKFTEDLNGTDFSNQLFLRVVAKEKKFTKVNFRYTIFDTCYFRKCIFDSCNFTGCRFSGTNLQGSKFDGCIFDYVVFEGTQVEPEILNSGAPGYENLQLKFARTLRMNYQNLGDSEAANKAINLELSATEVHLKKAWRSPTAYYRNKYKGWNRFGIFFKWLSFKILDLVWGNGESTLKLARAIFFMLVLMTIIHVSAFRNWINIKDYLVTFREMPTVFLGIAQPQLYSEFYLSVLLFIRLITFGFFISIMVKRFNRR